MTRVNDTKLRNIAKTICSLYDGNLLSLNAKNMSLSSCFSITGIHSIPSLICPKVLYFFFHMIRMAHVALQSDIKGGKVDESFHCG